MSTVSDHAEQVEPAEGWQEDANCLGVDPDLFFPERERRRIRRQRAQAQRVIAGA